MEYTAIVSLGYRCRTAFRLREYFGSSSAYPFDWWITPTKGAIRFLADWDIDRLFDLQSLEELRVEGGIKYVRHVRYGIKFSHDFPKDGEWVAPGWREDLSMAKARTAHIMEKFEHLNRSGQRVLFFRETPPSEEISEDLLTQLRRQIYRRLPDAECDFLLISPGGEPAKGWAALKIDDPSEQPWTGDRRVWDTALATLGHRHALSGATG